MVKLNPMDGLSPSYIPDKKHTAILKFLCFHYFPQFTYFSLIESNTSSQYNTNLMICLGINRSAPKVYYPIYEFIHRFMVRCALHDAALDSVLEDALQRTNHICFTELKTSGYPIYKIQPYQLNS